MKRKKTPTELLSMFIFIILVIMNFTSQQHIMQNKNNWVEAKLFRRSHRQLSHRRAFRDRGTSVMKKGQKSLFFLLFFKQLLEMMKAFAHYNETENVNHTLGCNSFSFTEDFHYFSSFYNTKIFRINIKKSKSYSKQKGQSAWIKTPSSPFTPVLINVDLQKNP